MAFASSTVMSILMDGFACMVACFRSQKLNCVNMIYSREYRCQRDLQLMYRSKTMERQPSREGLVMQTIQIRVVRALKREEEANQTKGKSDRHLINRSFLSSLIAPFTFVPVRSLGSSF